MVFSVVFRTQVVADTLGLNDSKYQYVIDALEADEIRRKTQEKDEEDRRQVLQYCSAILLHYIGRYSIVLKNE